MSLDDLIIKQHTAPILAELDRQKEKCAAMKQERDDHRSEADALRVERNVTARELTAEVARLKAERDASESLVEALQVEHTRAAEAWQAAQGEVVALRRECVATGDAGESAVAIAKELKVQRDRTADERDRLRAEVERLKAEVESATDLLNARGMSCGPDTDITRLLRQRDAARAEAASAAEKQRETCAQALFTCTSHTLAEATVGGHPCAERDRMAKVRATRLVTAAPRVDADAPIKCATFNPGSIPADVRAKMDADRARDAAPRVEFARERCPLLDGCCILPTGHTTACTVGGPHYKRTR